MAQGGTSKGSSSSWEFFIGNTEMRLRFVLEKCLEKYKKLNNFDLPPTH